MCGIAGIVHYNGNVVDRRLLEKMTDTLIHRGPDDKGYFINCLSNQDSNPKWKYAAGKGNVGLGQRRLSIIDLSSGHQPMTNEDATVWTTFNGEIYNFHELKRELIDKGHIFRTNSDTEVIIHGYEEWGEDCVRRFRGMFAFAVWDEIRQVLFLARDRLGKKPLYYYLDSAKFVFGSEIKAILEHPGVPREIDIQGLYDYLCLLYVPAPKSIFKNIHKILPGNTLTINNGAIRQHEYWDLSFAKTLQATEAEWCERIIAKLRDSVELRLISDVPVGAFLSGGVDSSAIVALMSALEAAPVKTSSIGFREDEFNELPYARKIAEAYGTDHHEMTVAPNAIGTLEKLVTYFDEPFADSSAIPAYYVSKMARENVTVALSGDGGDENFAGYRRYYFDRLENSFRGLFPSFFRRRAIGALAAIYPKADWLPQIFRAKTLLTNLSLSPVEGFYNSMSWFHGCGETLLHPSIHEKLQGYSPILLFQQYYDRADAQTSDPLSKVQYVDIKTYLADDILAKVDRTSMANSLEVRVPLLDHEFMELVAALPSRLKLKNKESKYIFKKSLEPMLPQECLSRSKMGFSIPLSRWLRSELKPIFEERVFASDSFVLNHLNPVTVRRMWSNHLKGHRNNASELWAILFLEKWANKWCI